MKSTGKTRPHWPLSSKATGFELCRLHVPIGRLYAEDMFDLARMAEVHGSSEIRLTVEQNLIIPNILTRAWKPS